MSNPKILAVVPARGGSKGIPGKNIKVLNDKPLLAYTAEAALGSEYVTHSILSTDDEKIAEVGRSLGLEVPFLRPADLSQDLSPTLPVITHAVTFMEERLLFSPDYVVILQPTSPFRTSQHIDESLEILVNSNADSIVSVTDVPHSFNPYSVMKEKNGLLEAFLDYDEKDNMRQKKPLFYGRNGAAIYAFNRDCLMEKNSIYGDKVLPYFMDKKTSLDLDDEWDWQMAVLILENKLLSSE